MPSLTEKVALVSGGNRGIGLATAREFHTNGARVVISGRNPETLEEVSCQLGPMFWWFKQISPDSAILIS